MQKITQVEAADLIRNSGGKVFTVEFERRTKPHGTRVLTGRRGVRAGVSGEGLGYDPLAHKLIPVAELLSPPRDAHGRFTSFGEGVTRHQFRSVPVEGIRSVRLGGEKYTVV